MPDKKTAAKFKVKNPPIDQLAKLHVFVRELPAAIIVYGYGSAGIQAEFDQIFALSREAIVAFVDAEGNSILHWAVRTGNAELVQRVCTEYSELIDQTNQKQGTPLHLAIDTHALAISRMLIHDFHANLFILNKDWLTPLARAKQNVDILLKTTIEADFLEAGLQRMDAKAILHLMCQLSLTEQDVIGSIVPVTTLMQLRYQGKAMTQSELKSIMAPKSSTMFNSDVTDMYTSFAEEIRETSNSVLRLAPNKSAPTMTSKILSVLVQGVNHNAWQLSSLDLAMNLFVLLPLLPKTQLHLFLKQMENRIGIEELNPHTYQLDFNVYMSFLKEVILLLKTKALYSHYVRDDNLHDRRLNIFKKMATDSQMPYASIQAIRSEDKDLIGETHAFAKLALRDAESWMEAELSRRYATYIAQCVSEQQQVQRDAVAQYFAPEAAMNSQLPSDSASMLLVEPTSSQSVPSSSTDATSVPSPASPPLSQTWCSMYQNDVTPSPMVPITSKSHSGCMTPSGK